MGRASTICCRSLSFNSAAPQGPLFSAQYRKSVESSSVGSLALAPLGDSKFSDSAIPDSRIIPHSGIGNLESEIPIELRPKAALGSLRRQCPPVSFKNMRISYSFLT